MNVKYLGSIATCLVALFFAVNCKVKELKVEIQSKPDRCDQVASKGDEVSVHYTGKLEDGKVFDSSVLAQREPISFTLGAGRVIPGWEQGILGMCVGEKRLLTIPSHLAYGSRGSPPQIPPDATLIFETELVNLVSAGGSSDEIIFKTIRFLSIPAVVLYIVYYLYKKYKTETESTGSKAAKDKRKKRK